MDGFLITHFLLFHTAIQYVDIYEYIRIYVYIP